MCTPQINCLDSWWPTRAETCRRVSSADVKVDELCLVMLSFAVAVNNPLAVITYTQCRLHHYN